MDTTTSPTGLSSLNIEAVAIKIAASIDALGEQEKILLLSTMDSWITDSKRANDILNFATENDTADEFLNAVGEPVNARTLLMVMSKLSGKHAKKFKSLKHDLMKRATAISAASRAEASKKPAVKSDWESWHSSNQIVAQRRLDGHKTPSATQFAIKMETKHGAKKGTVKKWCSVWDKLLNAHSNPI